MAEVSFDFDIGAIIPNALQDESLALEMVEAGQEVMLDAIQKGANKHRKTGAMANSLRKTKPVIDKNGSAVGRVKFTGSDGKSISKNGQKFDRTNWIKALRIEYGTSDQSAKPFVRPAIQSAQSAINAAMKKVYESKMK